MSNLYSHWLGESCDFIMLYITAARVEASLSLKEVFQSLKLSNKPKQMEF